MTKMLTSDAMKSVPAATPFWQRLMCWEGFLLAVTLAVFIANALASPYFLNIWNLSDATFNFTEKAIIVLPMAMLIIAREIDLSVASTMALSATVFAILDGVLFKPLAYDAPDRLFALSAGFSQLPDYDRQMSSVSPAALPARREAVQAVRTTALTSNAHR